MPDEPRGSRRRSRLRRWRASPFGLAFVAALQHLPPKQRAVLILREVPGGVRRRSASLLGHRSHRSTAHSSARGRRWRASRWTLAAPPSRPTTRAALLERYVDAFERYDMDSLTSLLATDATWNMPLYDLWLQTHRDIAAWCLDLASAARARAWSRRSRTVSPRSARSPSPDGGYEPWSLQVLEPVRRLNHRDHVLPRHREVLPALRPPLTFEVSSSGSPQNASKYRGARPMLPGRTSAPRRLAVSSTRASASTVPRSGARTPPTSHSRSVGCLLAADARHGRIAPGHPRARTAHGGTARPDAHPAPSPMSNLSLETSRAVGNSSAAVVGADESDRAPGLVE